MLLKNFILTLSTVISMPYDKDMDHDIKFAPKKGINADLKRFESNSLTKEEMDDHVVSISKNVDTDNFQNLVQLMQERMSSKLSRNFEDFVKMAFWQAVISHTSQHDAFSDIHELNFTAAKTWWMDNFVDYGCYCWPEFSSSKADPTKNDDQANTISGFGQPVDPLDTECFELYNCYRCVTMQPTCKNVSWVNSHYDCQFITVTSQDNGQDTLSIQCNDQDPCMQSLCECDKKFALNARLALEFRKDASHNENIFPKGCPRTGEIDQNKKCCGDWPNVKPFSRQTQCCSDNSIYEIAEGVCTDDDISENGNKNHWGDFFGNDKTHILNKNNPMINGHDHGASHENADHIHLSLGK